MRYRAVSVTCAATLAMIFPAAAQSDSALKRDEISGCENVILVGDRIISGGEPHSEEALAALAAKGVTTIVSVDGARPDVETARKFGIRYIHLPIGYDGIERDRAIEIGEALKAGRDGITYVHCHHGKHRGPAAVAMGLRILDIWNANEANAFLIEAGTSSKYKGLYADVGKATRATDAELAEVTELPEIADVGEIAANMAMLDRAADNLAASREAGWGVPADHPDVVPWREASTIVDLLRAADISDIDYDAEGFKTLLEESAVVAQTLQQALETGDNAAAEEAYTIMRQQCTACHDVWRN